MLKDNNIVFNRDYLTKIINYIFQNNNYDQNNYLEREETIYSIYENNYKNDSNRKEEYGYEDIFNYTVSSIMDIISKYDNNTDKIKLLTGIINNEYYKLNQSSKYYDFYFNEDEINNDDIEKFENILKEIDSINTNIYIHKKYRK